jgi:hypothetical protein
VDLWAWMLVIVAVVGVAALAWWTSGRGPKYVPPRGVGTAGDENQFRGYHTPGN